MESLNEYLFRIKNDIFNLDFTNKAFMTGSNVYGTPNKDSDIDIVFMDREFDNMVDTYKKEFDALELKEDDGLEYDDSNFKCIIDGIMYNFIVFNDILIFRAWLNTTNLMKSLSNIVTTVKTDKDFRVSMFNKILDFFKQHQNIQ